MVAGVGAMAPTTAGEVETVLSSVIVAGRVSEEEASLESTLRGDEPGVSAGARVITEDDPEDVPVDVEVSEESEMEVVVSAAPATTVTVIVVTVTPLSAAASTENSEAALVVVVVVVPVVVVAVSMAVAAAATCEPTRVGNDAVIELEPLAATGANIPPSAPAAEMRLAALEALVQVTNCFFYPRA